jgi:hypothetical protein
MHGNSREAPGHSIYDTMDCTLFCKLLTFYNNDFIIRFFIDTSYLLSVFRNTTKPLNDNKIRALILNADAVSMKDIAIELGVTLNASRALVKVGSKAFAQLHPTLVKDNLQLHKSTYIEKFDKILCDLWPFDEYADPQLYILHTHGLSVHSDFIESYRKHETVAHVKWAFGG